MSQIKIQNIVTKRLLKVMNQSSLHLLTNLQLLFSCLAHNISVLVHSHCYNKVLKSHWKPNGLKQQQKGTVSRRGGARQEVGL